MYFSNLGQAPSNLTQAVRAVKIATALVSKLTKDVKIGIAPRSDLLKAMQDLETKIKSVKNIAGIGKTLNGDFGDSNLKRNSLLIIGILIVILYLSRK